MSSLAARFGALIAQRGRCEPSALPEQDVGEPQRDEKVFSQAFEIDRCRAAGARLVPQRDRCFDGDQSMPQLKTPPVDVDRCSGALEPHYLRLPGKIWGA